MWWATDTYQKAAEPRGVCGKPRDRETPRTDLPAVQVLTFKTFSLSLVGFWNKIAKIIFYSFSKLVKIKIFNYYQTFKVSTDSDIPIIIYRKMIFV